MCELNLNSLTASHLSATLMRSSTQLLCNEIYTYICICMCVCVLVLGGDLCTAVVVCVCAPRMHVVVAHLRLMR